MSNNVKLAGRWALGLAAILAMGSVWQSAASAQNDKTEDDAAIVERQEVMNKLGKDADVLGDIVAGTAPASGLAEAASAVAQDAQDSVEAFEAKVPGGRSKPEVWTNYADFSARMQKFAEKAKAMADVAESGKVSAVTDLLVEAMPCKDCHDLYRAPKKS